MSNLPLRPPHDGFKKNFLSNVFLCTFVNTESEEDGFNCSWSRSLQMGNDQKMTPIGMNILYTLSRLKPLKASISQVSSIHQNCTYHPSSLGPWNWQFSDCQPNCRHFASLTHRSAFSRNAYGSHFTSTAATLVGLWAKFGTVSCDVYRRSLGEGERGGRREADDWITSGLADDWITSGLDEITWWVTWFLCSWEAPVWRDFFLGNHKRLQFFYCEN